MHIVISIATMNSRDRLRECLASMPDACRGLQWHAVVVDNCSDDGTETVLRQEFPSVEIIRNDEPRGFGANHNQVLSSALARFDDDSSALILNDDTVLAPGSVRALVASMEREPHAGAVTPRLVGADGERQPAAFRSLALRATVAVAFTGKTATSEDGRDADWLNGCCMLIPLKVLRKVGLFDERFFMYSEDVDLTLRIKAHGLRLWQCTESTVVHHGAGTTSQPGHSAPMRLQAARSYYQLLRKHRGQTVAVAVTTAIRAAHLLRGTAQLVAALVTGDERRRDASNVRLQLARYNPRRAVFPDREGRSQP